MTQPPRPLRGAPLKRQLLSPGEALVDAVPVADLVLAELPAEEDLLAVAQCREVDEPTVDVLHYRAELLDAVDRTCDRGRGALDVRLHLGRCLRRDPAAVRLDHRLKLLLALERP